MQYAHRKCIQRWCNQKGNTKCEICLQVFEFFSCFWFLCAFCLLVLFWSNVRKCIVPIWITLGVIIIVYYITLHMTLLYFIWLWLHNVKIGMTWFYLSFSNISLGIELLLHYFNLGVYLWISGNLYVALLLLVNKVFFSFSLFLICPLWFSAFFGRGNWAMSRRDLHSTTRYVHAVSHAQSFRSFNYDQYSPSPSVVLCSVTTFVISLSLTPYTIWLWSFWIISFLCFLLQFMVLLVLSHSLPLLEMIDNVEYSIPLLMVCLSPHWIFSDHISIILLLQMFIFCLIYFWQLLLMGIVGILVLICVTLRTVTFIMRLWPQEQHQRVTFYSVLIRYILKE